MSTFIHIPTIGEADVFALPVGWTEDNLVELMRCGAYNPPVVARQEKKLLTYHGSHTFINTLLSHPLVVVYVQQNSVNLNYPFQYKGQIHVIGNVGLVVPVEVLRDIGLLRGKERSDKPQRGSSSESQSRKGSDLTELSDMIVQTQVRQAILYDQEIREEALRRLASKKREADIQAMMKTLRNSS